MKILPLVSLFSLLAAALPLSASAAKDPLHPFPPAKPGQVRHVIELPPTANDFDHKVELIIGKTVPTDGVNTHFFGGSLTRKNIEGWGYSTYELDELGPMAGTLMAAPEGQAKVDTFVRVNHQLGLLRYNSKLPIVVYTPADVEVKFRIWTADETMHAAEQR